MNETDYYKLLELLQKLENEHSNIDTSNIQNHVNDILDNIKWNKRKIEHT